jgi:hypothetical protein
MRTLVTRARVPGILDHSYENDLWGTNTQADSIPLIFLVQCLLACKA